MNCPRCDSNPFDTKLSDNVSKFTCKCGLVLYSSLEDNKYYVCSYTYNHTVNVWYIDGLIYHYHIRFNHKSYSDDNFISVQDFIFILDWNNLNKIVDKLNMFKVFS